jgi:hypothetical protein
MGRSLMIVPNRRRECHKKLRPGVLSDLLRIPGPGSRVDFLEANLNNTYLEVLTSSRGYLTRFTRYI